MGIQICVAFFICDTGFIWDCISQLFHLVRILTFHVEVLGLGCNLLVYY